MSNYFPLSDQSEADILRRIWLLIDTVFDYSAIKSRSGEKSSRYSLARHYRRLGTMHHRSLLVLIVLTSVLRKLFELCLQTTLEGTTPSLNPVQGCFRHSRSALDQALCLNELCRQHSIDHHGEPPVLAFLDIKPTSSSDGLNAARTIANINQAARKLMGRKVDMVYKLQPNEYGCMECGKDENNSTKELSDGMFKIPIIMKDIVNSLAKKTSSLVNDITISSLMIMGTKISLIIMDSPGGNVCRISRLKPLYFPVCPLNFMSSLVSIMKLVYTARLNMEKTYLLIAKNEPALEYDLGEDPPIPPTFHNNLKRKRDFAEDDTHKSNTEEFDTASNA
ncbi:hypothetical protein G6F58_003370 [Rhizopus delemar]|nr:hypothetical protein G6F58_003370 [Rhizopus delemar]